MGTLDGQVALISGTGRGQGREAALIFTKAGARVLGCDVLSEESAETLRLVKAQGGEMESIHPLDVSDPADAARWVQTAMDKWGRIDVLYNNGASLRSRSPFGESTLEDWNETLRYELTIVYVSSRAVWPVMVKQKRGLIINVGSISGHVETHPMHSSAHGATKAGAIALTRMLAAEGAPYNIRSVSISPGIIDTPTVAPILHGDDPAKRAIGAGLIAKVPMGRAGKPAEIAGVAAFLASEAASYINGTDIAVDGGFTGVSFRGA